MQNMAAPTAPDALKGQFVSVAFSDYYSQAAYQGGAFRTQLLERWLKATGMVEKNLETFVGHPRYDDFWKKPPTGNESRTCAYDPKDPVPNIGGQELGVPLGPMDQRRAEKRPDVLLFTTDALQEPVEVTGRIRAKLFVSSDCPDTDFTVKLTDVYPDGRSMLVTDGILRARYHQSFERATFLESGQVYELNVDLWSTSLVFNQGHRIRIAVSSSNAPRFEANPNTGKAFRADQETRMARNTVHLSLTYPSHVVLPVVR